MPRVRVIRAGEGAAIAAQSADFVATLLSSGSPHARRDLYLLTLEPGTPRIAEPHIPGSIEHIVVARGSMRAGPLDALIDLRPGDYATFRGDVPHCYEALEPATWGVHLMEHI